MRSIGVGLAIIIVIVICALVAKLARRNRSKRKNPVMNLPRTVFYCPECRYENWDPESIVVCGGCKQSFLTIHRSN